MDDFKIKGNKNPKIKSTIDDSVLKFRLGKEDLAEPDDFEFFIKSVESAVRSDPRYTNYISDIHDRGFDRDVFQSGISNDKFPKTKIEMHHGPLFSLYDLCAIVTDHLLSEGEKVCTFDVASLVLREHELHHVLVVMLTKTNHQAVHEGKIFVHINQAIPADVLAFIKTYKKGIRREHLYTLEKYLELCKENDATDNDFLQLREVLDKTNKYLKKNGE